MNSQAKIERRTDNDFYSLDTDSLFFASVATDTQQVLCKVSRQARQTVIAALLLTLPAFPVRPLPPTQIYCSRTGQPMTLRKSFALELTEQSPQSNPDNLRSRRITNHQLPGNSILSQTDPSLLSGANKDCIADASRSGIAAQCIEEKAVVREGRYEYSTPHAPLPSPANTLSEVNRNSPLDWVLDPRKEKINRLLPWEQDPRAIERVLARRTQAEALEENTHLKSDHRQAWITISLAAKGHPAPFVEASQIIYGKHPDRVFPAITATRKAKLGKEYGQWFADDGRLLPDLNLPKKPSRHTTQSERLVADSRGGAPDKKGEIA